MIIPNCDLNSNFVSLNCNQPGISFEGVFLFLKIRNTDKFFQDYQENAYVFLNKIYYLFHSIGSIFLGENIVCRNLIIWKKREEFLKLMQDYSCSITHSGKKPFEESRNTNDKRPCFYDRSTSQFVNLSVICAIKFISSLYKEISEFSEISRKYNMQVVLYSDCGSLFYGYFSSILKLNNVFVGSIISDAYKLTVIIMSFI